jgi:predicted metal-dependent phosphoesterase TrpH
MVVPDQSLSENSPAAPGWLKIDFHLHTREDPKDRLDHSAIELLHRARALGFDALAITLHDYVLDDPAVFEAARELGILLIPATELRLEGADVVVVNISPEEARTLQRWSDIAEFRERRGRSALIFAPHPFYVLGGSMGRRLFEYMDLFDAIEVSHFHTRWFDRNRPAIRAAQRFQKPLIATSDTHRLDYFGDHYSLVQADRDATPEAIFDAIRAGCIRPMSPALTTVQFAEHLWWIFVGQHLGNLRARASDA